MTLKRPLSGDESPTLMAGEVPFDISEMFFSRTDNRGVIQAGSDVFRRVSGLDWENLVGSPHNIMRHADMPQGMFHIMWERLKQGRAVGVYIKNRSKDGRFFWVFAVLTPTDNGYVSVCLKPSSPILDKIEDIYAQVLTAETDGMPPAKSSVLLMELLQSEGYANYMVFQSLALVAEVTSRAKRMEHAVEGWQTRFRLMADSIMDIQDETEQMLHAFRSIRTVPMNMRILASRLEDSGGPISAISVNYGAMLGEMMSWVQSFSLGDDSPFARIRNSILKGQFLAFTALVQSHMLRSFKARETQLPSCFDIKAEKELLREQASHYRFRATRALKIVELEVEHLARSVLDMKRYVTGLSSTRMMCKIESAMLEDSGDALAGILEQLDYCQATTETRLSRISELNGLIQANTDMLNATA